MKRTVVITGASRGIGAAIAEALLHKGHHVIGLARDFSHCQLGGDNFSCRQVDFSELELLPAFLKELQRDFPDIDTLICNAGRGQFGSLEEFSFGQISRLMDVNFTSQAYVTRSFLPLLKQRPRADIVFIGSEAALSGGRRGAVYCASKFALRGLAQALRDECARGGVRVGIVNPGMTDTDFYRDLHFQPGDGEDNAIAPADVAAAVMTMLEMRAGSVVDEISLSPKKKVIRFKQESE